MSAIEAAVMIMLFAGMCFFLWRWLKLRREIYRFTDDMDKCLEEMIQGKEEICFDETSEDVLSKLQTKLKRLYEMQQHYASDSMKEKEKIQSLISDISHQTKTPAANMKMYLEILENRDNSPETTEEFLKLIGTQIEKLEFLIGAMLKMSRLENGILKIEKKPELLAGTIGNALAAVMGKADAKKIRIEADCPPRLSIPHDAKWTEEAVYNILDNAVKYTESGGWIKVSVTIQEIYVKISIADNGRGIAEENLGRIFQRFYREKEVHGQEGVGIGLYLAREIIARQQGYIEVRSKKGEGSEFCIYLTKL